MASRAHARVRGYDLVGYSGDVGHCVGSGLVDNNLVFRIVLATSWTSTRPTPFTVIHKPSTSLLRVNLRSAVNLTGCFSVPSQRVSGCRCLLRAAKLSWG